MNRKIKFRMKDKQGEWQYVEMTCSIIEALKDPVIPGGIDIDENTIGQYTGIDDKNGKEIYEGDIVRKFNGIIGKVIYEHSEFIIDVTNNKKLDYGRLDLIENFVEVIGNIYDNPDLLGKGAEE